MALSLSLLAGSICLFAKGRRINMANHSRIQQDMLYQVKGLTSIAEISEAPSGAYRILAPFGGVVFEYTDWKSVDKSTRPFCMRDGVLKQHKVFRKIEQTPCSAFLASDNLEFSTTECRTRWHGNLFIYKMDNNGLIVCSDNLEILRNNAHRHNTAGTGLMMISSVMIPILYFCMLATM